MSVLFSQQKMLGIYKEFLWLHNDRDASLAVKDREVREGSTSTRKPCLLPSEMLIEPLHTKMGTVHSTFWDLFAMTLWDQQSL